MSQSIKNRYEFVYLFDAVNSNPNGDPDSANAPRVDPQDMHGIVSDVCIKRKIRNFLTISADAEKKPGNRIYVQHHGVLERLHKEGYDFLEIQAVEEKNEEDDSEREEDAGGKKKGGKKGKRQNPEDVKKVRAWMCQNFIDIRMFGAVMSTKLYNAGQVRGAVQVSFSRSIDPILPLDLSITRMAVTNEKEKEGKDTTMGRKNLIPYGLYRCHGFVSANLAKDTGFNEEDLALLWDSLKMMWEHDRSAARTGMAPRKLIVFKHQSVLGNMPAHQLFERIKVEKTDSANVAPRSYADYRVTINKDGLSGVEIMELI